MNKTFVELWEKHKDELREQLKILDIGIGYEGIVKLLIKHVINNGDWEYDIDNITVITDGDYQGDQLFIIKAKCYINPGDYIVTWHYYGSCSGCDTLMNIESNGKEDWENNKVYYSGDSLNDLMKLCLHLIQHMKFIYTNDEVKL